ncbi:hypothetical protein CF326_g9764 [Tilletia indica]|nr:hypothetical protein CF326_g9764 [Tilletia indica]
MNAYNPQTQGHEAINAPRGSDSPETTPDGTSTLDEDQIKHLERPITIEILKTRKITFNLKSKTLTLSKTLTEAHKLTPVTHQEVESAKISGNPPKRKQAEKIPSSKLPNSSKRPRPNPKPASPATTNPTKGGASTSNASTGSQSTGMANSTSSEQSTSSIES